MKRQLVSSKHIATYITQELQKVEDCKDCKIRDVLRLHEPDNEGCNWSSTVVASTGGVPATYFNAHLNEIIVNARATFNLIDND